MDVVENDIRLFQNAIRDYSPYDFSEYSIKSLRRRLTKILLDYKMDMNGIVHLMRTDPELIEELIKKITVTTTELFRDPLVWKYIRIKVIPGFKGRDVINIWHPGCSSGQEVYSMMILLDDAGILNKCNIYGSDLNSDVLRIARKGTYKYRFNKDYLENFDKSLNYDDSGNEKVRNIPWGRYFNVDEARDIIEMKDFLKEKPVFRKLDLVRDRDHFFVNFDLIICRNVIIYFNYELQNKIFDLFHQSLNEKGCLILGPHESILGPFSDRFARNDHCYYKK